MDRLFLQTMKRCQSYDIMLFKRTFYSNLYHDFALSGIELAKEVIQHEEAAPELRVQQQYLPTQCRRKE